MRVLVLTHRLPFAPNRGDRIRAYHLLRLLARRHDVHLLSLIHDDEESRQLDPFPLAIASATGVRVPRVRNLLAAAASLAGGRPLTHVLLNSPGLHAIIEERAASIRPDVVIAYCSGMARVAFEPPLDGVPCIVDLVDLDSEKWTALAASTRGPLRRVYAREGRLLRRFEREVLARAAATTIINDRERDLVRLRLGDGQVHVAGNGVDVQAFAPPADPPLSNDVIFCGVFDYAPNEQGAEWLATTVWPRVKANAPEARLKLVGMRPSRRVRALAQAGSIDVVGAVPDVRPHLWTAALAVAPIHLSRGTQNKVLEAIAAGLPCVVTPAVHDGLPCGARPACFVHGEAEPFADAILRLLNEAPPLRREIARRADLSGLEWDAQLQPFLDLLAALARTAEAHPA